MRKSGNAEGGPWSQGDDSRLAADDLDRLIFRKRVATAPGSHWQSSPQLMWIVLAVVGAFAFVLLVRALLDRTSGTVGSVDELTASEPFVPAQASAVSIPFPERESRVSASIGTDPVHMVYRCVGKGSAVSLQSQPCAADQRVTRAIYAPPEAERVRRPTVVSSAPAQSSTYYGGGTSAADDERARRQAACANAKASREDTLRSVGLKRTYDLLQRLDAMVYEACKGQ
jgi:hypothetical protein